MKLLIGIVALLFLLTLVPLAEIWALNTLFPGLGIPYTFRTWAAIVVVSGLFAGSYRTTSK